MQLSKFLQIKSEYDKFYHQLLAKGRLPLKDTGFGYWAMACADDIYPLFKRIRLEKAKNFLDLGSGDGKVVMIASLFTKSTGIELDKELYDKSVEIKDKLGVKARLLNTDYHSHDLSKYDWIFYHPDQQNHKLEAKMMKELKGKLIVYGGHHHPTSLKREMSFMAETTPVTIFGNR